MESSRSRRRLGPWASTLFVGVLFGNGVAPRTARAETPAPLPVVSPGAAAKDAATKATPKPVVPLAKLEAGALHRPSALKPRAVQPPATPKGLEPCREVLAPSDDMPRDVGETIRYHVDINGLSVGSIDFKVEKQGTYGGKPVTEYRSLFRLDSLVSTFVSMDGRAAALVPSESHSPSVAMSSYEVSGIAFEEQVSYDLSTLRAQSVRKRNGTAKEEKRAFGAPARDFLSGFYMFRALPRGVGGCTIVYANQRAYTAWIQPDGEEDVLTPVGRKRADRYVVRYASDRSKESLEARVWIGQDDDRLPYQAEIQTKGDSLVARIHLYQPGK